MLTLIGGTHGLGGIAGYDAKETGDEDPDRLATVQRMTAAYLRSALDDADQSWFQALGALRDHGSSIARVDAKRVEA
jgi:hypothetical protein